MEREAGIGATAPAKSGGAIPELPRGCNSWVVTSPDGRVFEMWKRSNVQKAADHGWRVEAAADYLCRIAKESKATGAQP